MLIARRADGTRSPADASSARDQCRWRASIPSTPQFARIGAKDSHRSPGAYVSAHSHNSFLNRGITAGGRGGGVDY